MTILDAKISKYIKNYKLSINDKDDLIKILMTLKKDEKREILDLIEKDAGWIKKLNNNLKSKKMAILNKDANAWNNIINDEIEMLSNIKK